MSHGLITTNASNKILTEVQTGLMAVFELQAKYNSEGFNNSTLADLAKELRKYERLIETTTESPATAENAVLAKTQNTLVEAFRAALNSTRNNDKASAALAVAKEIRKYQKVLNPKKKKPEVPFMPGG